MVSLTMSVGALLSLLGLAAYVVTGMVSLTALIPTFFGVPLVLVAQLAKTESRRKLGMHIAVVIALLGLIGSASGIPKVLSLLAGGEIVRPEAATIQTLMALTCLVYVVMSVRSFLNARRAG